MALVWSTGSYADQTLVLKCTAEEDVRWALNKPTVIGLKIDSEGLIRSGSIDGNKVAVQNNFLRVPNSTWTYSFENENYESEDLKNLKISQSVSMLIVGNDFLAGFNAFVNCIRIH